MVDAKRGHVNHDITEAFAANVFESEQPLGAIALAP